MRRTETVTLSRRAAIHLTLFSAAGAVLSANCGGAGLGPQSFGSVSGGNVSALSVGTIAVVPGEPVFVARDAGGVYAMSTTCTHAGCDLANSGGTGTAGEIACPCHGSVFDANGNAVRGPATQALAHFEVTIDPGGNITVNGRTEVSASVRVPA